MLQLPISGLLIRPRMFSELYPHQLPLPRHHRLPQRNQENPQKEFRREWQFRSRTLTNGCTQNEHSDQRVRETDREKVEHWRPIDWEFPNRKNSQNFCCTLNKFLMAFINYSSSSDTSSEFKIRSHSLGSQRLMWYKCKLVKLSFLFVSAKTYVGIIRRRLSKSPICNRDNKRNIEKMIDWTRWEKGRTCKSFQFQRKK